MQVMLRVDAWTKAASLSLLLALPLLSCGDDPTGPADPLEFEATLTGAEERPNPTGSTATGTATFRFDPATSVYSYTITVNGITNVVGAHIHVARQGVNGSIAVDFFPAGGIPAGTVNGQLSTGTIGSGNMTATAPVSFGSLLPLMRNGDVYVNVHTQTFAGGEIRGQIRPKP